ncbi:MAG: hypothetical protein AB7E31_10500 [Desulfitobacterium sp.]
MRARRPLFTLLLILAVVLGSSTAAVANPNQVNQVSIREINEYTPPDVGFHSPGHIQRWETSPLSEQNPHLWTTMLLTFLVSGGVFTSIHIRKKRREAKGNPTDQLKQYLSELKKREERLTKRFQEVDLKYRSGGIAETDYKRFLKSYEENLSKTQEKIREIEQMSKQG